MQIYFLHNHYLPTNIKCDSKVRSIIVPEFYPDLNMKYLGDPCHFHTVGDYITYVLQCGYYQFGTVFSIENPAIFRAEDIENQLASLGKLGVKIYQVYCGKNNIFYSAEGGLSALGERYLYALSEQNMILDLSHIHNTNVRTVAACFSGRIIVSHCAGSALYLDGVERSNSLSDDNIMYLSRRSTLFGISFLNDIVSKINNHNTSTQILNDIIEQIFHFVSIVGSENVGFGPDFIDIEYFSKRFGVQLAFPNKVFSSYGFDVIAEQLGVMLSRTDIENIFWRNTERLLRCD